MIRLSMNQAAGFAVVLLVVASTACARLPYTTRVVADDERVGVRLEQEIDGTRHAHPVSLTAGDVAAILRGLSLRRQTTVPLRWFAEETPPKKIFREDEIEVLAPRLAEALRGAGPGERIAFELRAPGQNPRYDRDITAGWLAVRAGFFHLTIDYFHSQQPATRSSPYDYNYPTPRSSPTAYVLYFEPGRFWVMDDVLRKRGIEFRPFLESAERARP